MKTRVIFTLAGLIALSANGACLAGAVTEGVRAAAVSTGKAVFSDVERRMLEEYLARRGIEHEHERVRHRDHDDHDGKKKNKHKGNGKPHKHGKGNPKGLPPGIQQKLARGGTMPPGIAKKHLPRDIESRLPPVRDGYERYVSDGKVVLVEAATGIITDVIDEVMGTKDSTVKQTGDRRDHRVDERDHVRERSHKETPADEQDAVLDDRRAASNEHADKESKKWWHFWK